MAYYPATPFVPQFTNDAGVPLSGGTITAYIAGTTTPTNMFVDDVGTSAGSVITLNARGEPQVSGNTIVIWLDSAVTYKFVLKDASGASKWTIDDIGSALTLLADSAKTLLGDALIAVKQPLTGAIARTQHDKNAERVSAKDFGAAGNGSTDDTAAIQAAHDGLPSTGGAIYCPAGIYKTTGVITISKPCIFYGDGQDTTTIRSFSAAGNIFKVTSTGYVAFTELTIDRDASVIKAAGTAGIEIDENNLGSSTSMKVVRNVRFANMYRDILVTDCANFVFEENTHINFLQDGVYVRQKDVADDHGVGVIQNNKFWDVAGTAGAVSGVTWESGSGLRVLNNRFLGQFDYGVYLAFNKGASDDGALIISGNLFERQQINSIRAQRLATALAANTKIGQIVITNNHFQCLDPGFQNVILIVGSVPGGWVKGVVIGDNIVQNTLNTLSGNSIFSIGDGNAVSVNDNVIYHEGTGDGGITVNGYATEAEIKHNTFYGGTVANRYPDTTATARIVDPSFDVSATSNRVPNIAIGSVAYNALGFDAAHVAGTLNIAEMYLPAFKTITGMGVLNGTVVGTDNMIVAIYSRTGEKLATSALAGTLSAGADSFQQIPLTAVIRLPAGTYWVVVQMNGTTARTRRIAASTYLNLAGTQAGVFGTIPTSITPPTTFTANAGPIAYLY